MIWRYKDFRSHAPFAQKRALITMMMSKVHKMASDKESLTTSALQKLAEFARLGYPPGLLRGVCNYMYMFATTRVGAWIDARDQLPDRHHGMHFQRHIRRGDQLRAYVS